MNELFRPFGPMNWILSRLPHVSSWSLAGTISPEERSLSVLHELTSGALLKNAEFIRVEPDGRKRNPKFRQGFIQKLNIRQKVATQRAASLLNVRSENILCREESLVTLAKETLSSCSENLIVDISAMPKRFFFTLLAVASESSSFENIVITYTTPERYGDSLAEDPERWKAFPMFGATPPSTNADVKLLISVGYQPLKLHEIVDGIRYNANNIELLLPFPSVHPGFLKNWEFILQIRREVPELKANSIKRISTTNTPLAFERIAAMTNYGKVHSVLAPFGPKPISLAMCLYGIACRANDIPIEIGYTQPQVYSDEYSTGVATINGEPQTTAYCIRLGGRNLYSLD